jgi:hypothetical protein
MAEVTVAHVPPGSLIVVYDAKLPDDARDLLAARLGHDQFAIWHVPKGGRVEVVAPDDLPVWLAEALDNGGRAPRPWEFHRPSGEGVAVAKDAVRLLPQGVDEEHSDPL